MYHLVIVSSIVFAYFVRSQTLSSLPPSCESDIYCKGELLNDIQLSEIYSDSKTFVDKRLLYSPDIVLQKYKELKEQYNNSIPSKSDISKFIDENFLDGNELDFWSPPDWSEQPKILQEIADPKLKIWAESLNGIWLNLSRKVDDKVKDNPEMYSLIYVPNGFIVPGGRFKELYYWDTYWIVKGLLICDMVQTAKGVIDNLLYLLKTIGHIPNGSRVYYLQRTQPPMITQMVYSYYKHTEDMEFVKANIELLDSEMDYFINNRMVTVEKNGESHKLFRYNAPSEGPRPESYREDEETASFARDNEEKQDVYTALKSAAESGWDFSTRWFIEKGTNKGNISNINTKYIVPVDLNALMHLNFKTLLHWYRALHREDKINKYKALSKDLLKGINSVFWNEEEGIWFDYDILNNIPRKYFYMSNFVPLWTKSYSRTPISMTKAVLKYIKKVKLTEYIGGSPTSFEPSGEQWDYPNAWPPLQAFLIQGLDRIGSVRATKLAKEFAKVFALSNYKGFQDFGAMFEKYSALESGRTGSGGEYEGQKGFGWTNGFAFEILKRWGAELRTNSSIGNQE